jgi:hypothetical protein
MHEVFADRAGYLFLASIECSELGFDGGRDEAPQLVQVDPDIAELTLAVGADWEQSTHLVFGRRPHRLVADL